MIRTVLVEHDCKQTFLDVLKGCLEEAEKDGQVPISVSYSKGDYYSALIVLHEMPRVVA